MSRVSRAETETSPGVPRTRPSSFDEFYVRELPRLVALARGLCGVTIAEDVAQEAMLVAFRRWREVGDLERPISGSGKPARTSRSRSSGGRSSNCGSPLASGPDVLRPRS